MGKTKPGSVKETGASAGVYLEGAEDVNRGMIIRVQEKQEQNRSDGGPVKGRFEIVVADGKYRDYLSQYEKQTVTAREVIDKIVPKLVEAGKLKRAVLCIFNCDLLRLYELDPLTDLGEHEQELMNLSPTARDAVIKVRIGQEIYRKNLIDRWETCAVTGVNNKAVLRASHVKPWRECSDGERLDPFNGLLLIPNLDILFDQHLITFEEDGSIKISRSLSEEDQKRLGISTELRLRKPHPRTEKYLSYHRKKFYLKECP